METPTQLWRAGLAAGLSALKAEPTLGLKRILLPVSYWRTAEFAYVARQLKLPEGARLLDVGSPKDFPILLARSRSYAIEASDILESAVWLGKRYAIALGSDGIGPGKVRFDIQDGRALTHPDNSFDAAFSISVLEHIPEPGDERALSEMIRVVKPGGLVVVTTPFDRKFRETFVDRPVYERQQVAGKPVFFERHYDMETLTKRFLRPRGAVVADLQLWGERNLRGERFLSRLGRGRAFLSPLEPVLSQLCLQRIDPDGPGHPMAAFFTLRKAG